jgi:hypothetical protein
VSEPETRQAELEDEIDRLKAQNQALLYEKARYAAMLETAVMRLVRIKSFAHPDGIVINGVGYSYNPPDALVREAWEALSKAIREIDIAT